MLALVRAIRFALPDGPSHVRTLVVALEERLEADVVAATKTEAG